MAIIINHYTYDATGNILSMDTANGTGTPNHLTFIYDADNRITNSGFEEELMLENQKMYPIG